MCHHGGPLAAEGPVQLLQLPHPPWSGPGYIILVLFTDTFHFSFNLSHTKTIENINL